MVPTHDGFARPAGRQRQLQLSIGGGLSYDEMGGVGGKRRARFLPNWRSWTTQ